MGRDGADAPYWDALAQGRLLLPRCTRCGAWKWPAGHRCGVCGNEGFAWVERPLRGTIFAWTRTWHRFALTEAFELPFVSVVASIDDCGIRLLGKLDDPKPDDPKLGAQILGRPGCTLVGEVRIPTIEWSLHG